MSSSGRPRSDASRVAILQAAFDILVKRGYAGMAIEAVAQAAGVGKTTIYRWWPAKADLAVEAFFVATADELALPQSSSAMADFHDQILNLAALLHGSRGAVLAAMLGGARGDPALAAALGARWLAPRRAWGMQRMVRAVADGQVRPGVKVPAALSLLYGPVYTPLLFGNAVPDRDSLNDILALSLNAIFHSD